MATLADRQFARDFSGLVNQTVAAASIATFCISIFEIIRRLRRGRGLKRRAGEDPLGSVETWEFGYLYQGRCWAEKPSPPHSPWVLGWVWQAIRFPEDKMLELVGTDATLYCRFLRGCCEWWHRNRCICFNCTRSLLRAAAFAHDAAGSAAHPHDLLASDHPVV